MAPKRRSQRTKNAVRPGPRPEWIPRRTHFREAEKPVIAASQVRRLAATACDSMETYFLDVVEKLQNERSSTPPGGIPRGHPLGTLIAKKLCAAPREQTTSHPSAPVLEAVPKAYEDAMLAAPTGNERPCARGQACEGVLMDRERGFILREFVPPGRDPGGEPGPCLLCLRKGVMCHYYNMALMDRFEAVVAQPHRNLVDVPGEYRSDCCIAPGSDRFEGVTDPFVAHQRHRYAYGPGKTIRQVGVGYFLGQRPGPRPLFPERGEEGPGRLIDERLISGERDGERRCELNAVLDAHLRGGPALGYRGLDDMVSVLPQCSFFFTKRYTEVPAAHIMSKALPQRCQYRNMREICKVYCRDHPAIRAWLIRCAQCSLLGYYPHSRVSVGTETKRALICLLGGMGERAWARWIDANGYLLFYIIKEYIVWIIRYDPALHEAVRQAFDWDAYEASCVHAMDTVKSIVGRNAPGPDLFAGVNAELKRVNAIQLRALYKIPKYGNTHVLLEAFRGLDASSDEASRRHIFQTVAKRSLSPRTPHHEWLESLGVSPRGLRLWRALRREIRTVDASINHFRRVAEEGFSPADYSIIRCYVEALGEERSIRLVRLPQHWYSAQLAAFRELHDTATACGTYYICTTCRRFKGLAVGTDPLRRDAWGQEKVVYDYENDRYFCGVRSSSRKRARRRLCSESECVPVSLLGNMLQCYGKCYVLCHRCVRPCLFSVGNFRGGAYLCPVCAETAPAEEAQCLFCHRARGDEAAWSEVTVAGETRHLCPAHSARSFAQVREWGSEKEVIDAVRGIQIKAMG